MTDRSTPWWYSGDDNPEEPSAPDADPQPAPESESHGSSLPGLGDLTGLLSGAARMVDWATTAVMAPHAEHTDPADHPQCIVCRTVTLVGDPIGLMSPGTADREPASGAGPAAEEAESAAVPDFDPGLLGLLVEPALPGLKRAVSPVPGFPGGCSR